MNRQNLSISGAWVLALCVASCATNEQTYWEKGKKGIIIVHHVRRTYNGTRDRTERLTSNAIRPAEVHAYDLGRMPDGAGGMHEAHEYYRVVESETFDLRIPGEGSVRVNRGPKTVLMPPTYTPPAKSQRINDAVAEAMDAKNKLDEARGKLEEQLAGDNNLRGELDQLAQQNQRLQDQVNAALGTTGRAPTPVASPSPASPAAQAGAQIADPLAQWGQKLGGTGTTTQP
jgi:hypothetical protein